MKSKILVAVEFALVLALCYFPLCYRIDAKTIRQWDEARNAVHTVEMARNHNYLIRTFEGMPETWETKPPLLIWLQLISCKIFGFNELGIRFPVVMASLLTVSLLILFFYRFLNNRYIGYAAALILVTSQGYVDHHIARTGDHDALLILITTAIILHVYLLMNSDKPLAREYIFIAVLFATGVLTKSIAVFFIVPGLALSLLILRPRFNPFTSKGFYIALAVFIVVTGGYYLTRELLQPGYLKAVWEWELLPRYTNSDNRFVSDSFWFYATNFFKSRYTFWIGFLVVSALLLPFILKNTNRRFYLFIMVNTVVLFIILSAGSKGIWYDGPLYPLFAILIALLLVTSGSAIINKYPRTKIPVVVVFCFLFAFQYRSVVKKVTYSKEWPWDTETYSMGYLLRNVPDTMPDPLKVVFQGYNAHLLFYVEADQLVHGRERLLLANFSKVNKGDTILISQQEVIDSISKHYLYRVLWSKDAVKLIEVGTN